MKGGREGWLGGRWSRVRNETILSSRGREGRCERVGVVFSPLRRLTSLRRGNGGGESGADVGRVPSRWGPRVRELQGVVGGRGPVKLTKMTQHLPSVSLSLLGFPFASFFPLFRRAMTATTTPGNARNFTTTLGTRRGWEREVERNRHKSTLLYMRVRVLIT